MLRMSQVLSVIGVARPFGQDAQMTICKIECCLVMWIAPQLDREVEPKSNGWIRLERTRSLLASHSIGRGDSRMGSVEGCLRMLAATHLICRLERV